ncbi:oligosaccharide flippase family protein [bacterium]|nr:oligosaccharide flippase family protein [bacterium]
MKLHPGSTANNAAFLTAGTATETLLQFVFVLIVSRELGPETFGFLGFLIAAMTIITTIAQFGLPVIAVREIAQRPHDEAAIFGAVYRLRQSFGLAFFLAVALYSIFNTETAQQTISVWLIFFYLLVIPFELAPVFDAHKLWRWDLPGKLAGRLSAILLLLILWKLDNRLTLIEAALCTALVNVVNVSIGWLIARSGSLSLRPFAATTEIKSIFLKAIPVAWSNLMQILYAQFQLVYVQWLSSALQTGYFALVLRLIIPLLLFKGVIYRILMPLISNVAREQAALRTRLETVFPLVALLFIPLTTATILLSGSLLVPLFGSEYEGSVLPFQIAVSQFIFTGFGSLFGTVLLAAGDAKPSTIGLTIGTAAGLLAGYLLVPPFGALGGAWAFWIGAVVASAYPIPAFLRFCRPAFLGRIIKISIPCLLALMVNYSVIYLLKDFVIGASIISIFLMVFGLAAVGELSQTRVRKLVQMIKNENHESA